MKRLRIYIDSLVIGGCLDSEFAEQSEALLEMGRRGEVMLLVSDLLADELARAPDEVQERLGSVSRDHLEPIVRSPEAGHLRDAYLEAGVVGPSSASDALHVAIATTADADVIVSWNFKHLVHLEKIRGFNAVNLREGYGLIEIRSPREVI